MLSKMYGQIAARSKLVALTVVAISAVATTSVSVAGVQTLPAAGNTIASDMAFVSPASNQLYLFRRVGTGSGTLRVYFADSSGQLSSGSDLGGSLGSGPVAVSWASNHMAVFVRWSDGSIRTRSWSGIGGWGAWINLGGDFSLEPGVVSMSPGHIAVFARGQNESVYIKEYNGGAWGSTWVSLGGNANTRPMPVSWGAGHMAVFVRGHNDEAVYVKQRNGSSWSADWTDLGGNWSGVPVPISRGTGNIEVFEKGLTSGKIYVRHYSSGSWDSDWTAIGSKAFGTNSVPVVLDDGRIRIFARSKNQESVSGSPTVYILYYNESYDGGYSWGDWGVANLLTGISGGNPVAAARDGVHVNAAIASGVGSSPTLYQLQNVWD